MMPLLLGKKLNKERYNKKSEGRRESTGEKGMRKKKFAILAPRLFFLYSLLVLLASSCASMSAQRVTQSWERPADCVDLFNRLDRAVQAAAVLDAATAPVPGFPYLRADRFLAGLGKGLKGEAEKREWVRWMQELDLQARRKEIENLPPAAFASLSDKKEARGEREGFLSQVASCSSRLLVHDMARGDFYSTLDGLPAVPDEYSSPMRVVGLYPLTAIPVAIATGHVQRKAQRWFSEDPGSLPLAGDLRTFFPAEGIFLGEKEIEKKVADSRKNLLGIFPLQEKALEELARHFAPVFVQDVAAPYDDPGRVFWKGDRAEVDGQKPTVYYYFSQAYLRQEPVLQINYVVWFSAREGKRAPWIERGRLDGLTVRVSLDGKGKTFMIDVINNCGCYHFFVPDEGRVRAKIPQPSGLEPFVPQWLPRVPSGERFGIRVNSGWHQVERILPVKKTAGSDAYELVPYEDLESLPRGEGSRESLFDSQGIAKGTERIEPLIFFPMGVPRVGSMRQRGHHAVVFIGRAHFDDPELFNRNFAFQPGAP
jgi:hypothetical protein